LKELNNFTFRRRLVRKFIRASTSAAPIGGISKWYGTHRGWRLDCGLRVRIEDPSEYIQACILSEGVYEPEIAQIIQRLLKPGDVFIDVGANIGNHTLVAASCGAKVHAFEPVPRIASALRANIKLNHLSEEIIVREEAVGDAPGFAMINIADRNDNGSHSLIEGIEARSVEQQRVSITRLDDYIESLKAVPTLVKIDVEGYEARVLDGASQLLQNSTVSFIIETADRIADRIGESARSVIERMFKFGYTIFLIPETGPLACLDSVDKVRPDLANYLCIASKSKDALAVGRELANELFE